MSALSSLRNYLVTNGQRLLEAWKSDKNTPLLEESEPLPANIIGLPRLLTRNGGERLFYEMALDDETWEALFTEKDMVKWLARRGRTAPRGRVNRIRRYYADLRHRHLLLERIQTTKNSKRGVPLVQLSLELRLLMNHFSNATKDVEPERTVLAERISSAINDPLVHACVLKICRRITNLNFACLLILLELSQLLPQWPSLRGRDRERIIIGVFLLVSVSGSFVPLSWALRQVPELAPEFTNLRPVHRRTRGRHRPPTQRQKSRIRRLWHRQMCILDRHVAQMHSQVPSRAQVLRLRRQARSLWLINKTRSRHHHAK